MGIRPSDEAKDRYWFFVYAAFRKGEVVVLKGEVVVRLLQGFLVDGVQEYQC
jgi:hypothetical protein